MNTEKKNNKIKIRKYNLLIGIFILIITFLLMGLYLGIHIEKYDKKIKQPEVWVYGEIIRIEIKEDKYDNSYLYTVDFIYADGEFNFEIEGAGQFYISGSKLQRFHVGDIVRLNHIDSEGYYMNYKLVEVHKKEN